MKTGRAILAGVLLWIMIFSLFTVLDFMPGIQDSLNQQFIISYLFAVLFAYLGALFYYRKGNAAHGAAVGITMILVALMLDVLITVPFVEIPRNGSYQIFFTRPLLWLLAIECAVVVYFYWKFKVKVS